jgi:hypothetical protein
MSFSLSTSELTSTTEAELLGRPDGPGPGGEGKARMTLFTIPKPYLGKAGLMQRNALHSWLQFGGNLEVMLLGDEEGVESTAREFGVHHLPDLKRNRFGTPLLSDAFEQVHRFATGQTLLYCNSDVILLDDFFSAIEQVRQLQWPEYLGIGRRMDLRVEESIDFSDPTQLRRFRKQCQRAGKLSSIVCKEYFLFPRGLFPIIPDFAVGRGNWDNWMVRNAKQRKIPVISLSPLVQAIHQAHDYSHLQAGSGSRQRWRCYVSGEEAKRNQQLAGGQHLISGSTSDWLLEGNGVRRQRWPGLNLDFWLDLPRFAGLLASLAKSR